jgi:hypothetical protein
VTALYSQHTVSRPAAQRLAGAGGSTLRLMAASTGFLQGRTAKQGTAVSSGQAGSCTAHATGCCER